MQNIKLQNIIRQYKKNNIVESEQLLNKLDLLTDINIPNSLLFNYESCDNEILFNHTIQEGLDITHLNIKNKIRTNELYYGNGIIGNIHNIKDCDYVWLLGYFFIRQYNEFFNKNIKCFIMGDKNNSFVNGVKYYSSIPINFTYEIDSLRMYLDNCDKNPVTDVISGFKDNDLMTYSNLNQCKYMIEKKFDKINLIFNRIKPDAKNNKILVSVAILSITVLKKNGVLLTNILNPTFWNGNFLHSILLFIMIFDNVQIFRYPVCKKKYIAYKYYLVCHNRKTILHNSLFYRRLIMLLKSDETDKLLFLQNIIDDDCVKRCVDNILEARRYFINNADNPEYELNKLIYNLQEFDTSR